MRSELGSRARQGNLDSRPEAHSLRRRGGRFARSLDEIGLLVPESICARGVLDDSSAFGASYADLLAPEVGNLRATLDMWASKRRLSAVRLVSMLCLLKSQGPTPWLRIPATRPSPHGLVGSRPRVDDLGSRLVGSESSIHDLDSRAGIGDLASVSRSVNRVLSVIAVVSGFDQFVIALYFCAEKELRSVITIVAGATFIVGGSWDF